MTSDPAAIIVTDRVSAARRAEPVGIPAEEPATDRPHDEADGEDTGVLSSCAVGLPLGKNTLEK